MEKVLILGAKGMLGQELVNVYKSAENYQVTAWDRDDVDVCDTAVLRERITALWPDIIYNAVAYNAVDACEGDADEAKKANMLNSDVPGVLAKIAKTLDAIFVQYSTDYVFDGERPQYVQGKNPGCCGNKCPGCMYEGPMDTISYFEYREDDVPRPLSHYGRSKLQGENNVAKYAGHYYIIRLSKLFGKPASSAAGKKSFFDVMHEMGQQQREVRVIDGEVSKFTYAPDLAAKSKEIAESRCASGIYHVANAGCATWYEGAKELFAICGYTTNVVPVAPESYPRPARRPSSSVLKMTKTADLRHYREALCEYYGGNNP